jgi:hypothetical protein
MKENELESRIKFLATFPARGIEWAAVICGPKLRISPFRTSEIRYDGGVGWKKK